MNLNIHIGAEKTGSSYLQSMAAINRLSLQEAGIWFPKAGKRERHLQRGYISAGNSQPLTDALKRGNQQKAMKLLQEWISECQEKHCTTLLLSNELMLLALTNRSSWNILLEASEGLGIHSISLMLFLRDPVEQAFSLYKHRAKTGTALGIEEWPKSNYHYGTGLEAFFNTLPSEKIHLSCRKYQSAEGHLENIFFRDWLGTKIHLSSPTKKVNPSLTISELLFIKALHKKDPWLPRFLYEKWIEIPLDKKATEPRMTKYYKSVLASYVALYADIWAQCNGHLPPGEELKIPEVTDASITLEDKVMTFSEQQVEVLAAFLQESHFTNFKLRLAGTRWRKYLGRLINILLQKK